MHLYNSLAHFLQFFYLVNKKPWEVGKVLPVAFEGPSIGIEDDVLQIIVDQWAGPQRGNETAETEKTGSATVALSVVARTQNEDDMVLEVMIPYG